MCKVADKSESCWYPVGDLVEGLFNVGGAFTNIQLSQKLESRNRKRDRVGPTA